MIETATAGILIFSRLAGLLMLVPGISSRAVPAYARLLVAVPLTFLLLPVVGRMPPPTELSTLFGQVASEALFGVAMGLSVSLVFGALSTAAEVLSAQSGLQIASMLDPVTMTQPGAVGVLVTWLGTGVFLGANLHLRCITALGASLQAIPPGQASSAFLAADLLVPLGGVALSTGIQLAGPLTAFVFCVNLGLSLLGRMAPGLQLFFAIGPTITVAASFALIAISLPLLLETWYDTLPRGFAVLATMLGRGG